ncbi:hypothetical protein CC2G_006447 [Coprinopsis cinerea AmutBmut pab1-1]|nr:hypothetical protein CC2G_006447 [Coprinopsis cinerea AmutBmut pab1-1]
MQLDSNFHLEMARPKKYHTKAERKEANRAKNRKYYSRKKDEINRHRREKHAKNVARLARRELRPWTQLGEGRKGTTRSSTHNDETVKRSVAAARVIFRTYQRVVSNDASAYCLNLCRQLFKDFENGISIAEARNTAAYHANRIATFTKQSLEVSKYRRSYNLWKVENSSSPTVVNSKL